MPDEDLALAAKAAGNAFFSKGLYVQAVAEYDRAIEFSNSLGDVAIGSFFNRGVAKKHLNQFDGALADLNRCLELKPDHIKASFHRAETHSLKGNHSKAIEELEALSNDATIDASFKKTILEALRKAQTGNGTSKPAPPPPAKYSTSALPAETATTNGTTDSVSSTDDNLPVAASFLTAAEYATTLNSSMEAIVSQASSTNMESTIRRQRFDVARFCAQYQIRGLRKDDMYAVIPMSWWSNWCSYVGGFSDANDVAPCTRLMKSRGNASFKIDDQAVLAEYSAIADAVPGPLHPGMLDTRNLVAPHSEHIHHIPEDFLQEHGKPVFVGTPRDAVHDPVGTSSKIYLRKDAIEGEDFILLGWQVGDMLAAWYGCRGPKIYRRVVEVASTEAGSSRCVIDLFPELHRYDDGAALYEEEQQKKVIKATPCEVCAKPSKNKCSGCHNAHYCGVPCQRAHWHVHKGACGAQTSKPVITRPGGLVGLSNLGNTCFMNSSLQALSACWPLTAHFLSGKWEKDLNIDNPMGTHGRLARAYADLMRSIWLPSSNASYVTPYDVKRAIGSFQERFSGFAQHDAQELLNYVLDGIHEDLNRIRKKEYVEDEEGRGRPDALVADLSWQKYLKRNESVVVDLFAGQLKSTLVCPKCEGVSVKFDPYHMLSVPLPTASRRTLLIRLDRSVCDLQAKSGARWVVPNAEVIAAGYNDTAALEREASLDRENRWELHAIVLDKSDKLRAVKAAIAGETGVSEDRLFVYRTRADGSIAIVDSGDVEVGSIFADFDETLHAVELCAPTCSAVTVPDEFKHLAMIPDDAASQARVIVLVEQAVPAAILQTDEISAQWQPSEKDLDRIITGSDVEGAPLIFSVPRGASIAHLRYLLARQLFRSVRKEIIRKMYFQSTGGEPDATTEVSEVSLIHYIATQLDIGVVSPSIPGVKPHWLPSFDGVNTAAGDGRNMRMDSAEGCAVGKSKTSLTVTTLLATWRGKWYAAFDAKRGNKAVEMPSVKRALRERAERESGRVQITLDQCWERFTQPETLDEANMWYCPACKDHVQARKTLEVWSLPDILIVHLKRFEARGLIWRDKLTVPVNFPLVGLDLTETCLKNRGTDAPVRQVYDCIAVVNHFGNMLMGHYTAFANHAVAKRPEGAAEAAGEWYNFDDAHVSPTSPSSVVSSAAYILVYKRRTTSDVAV